MSGLPAYAGTAGNYPGHQAIAGDFNGDGWTDILLQPFGGTQGTAELIAYPDGNFGAPLATWPSESGGTNWNADAHRLVVGDYNGDGRDDVLLQGAAGLSSRIAFARVDGNVSQTDVRLPDRLGGLDPSQANHHIVAGDFNGDGRDDLLLQANTFVGTNGVALADGNGGFSALASRWHDGFHGFSWSQDRQALTAGDFAATGSDELLMRSASAAGSDACCELIGFDKQMKPTQIVQHWAANFLGVDWQPSTHLAIVGDFNGDAHADVLLQPRAPGGEVDVVLTDAHGLISTVSDRWASDRGGVDWSAESYTLVPENATPGKGATVLMIPQQSGLAYRRAQFGPQGRLQSVTTITPPAAGIFSPPSTSASPGASGGGGLKPQALGNQSAPSGDAVGAMNGQASTSNGVAGYSIKIAVPPGRAGMQPALSLGYSSNGGDGHEGVGWSLGGSSSIYRCPATQASDGYTAGTTFSSSDRFCLDGQKLMLTSGSYGAAGSVYHAEVNGFAKIVAHGSQGNGPAYFTVQSADGATHYYGDSSSAKILSPGGSVFSWAQTMVEDLDGNRVIYQYTKTLSGHENYLREIDYTLGNGAPGATRKVTFTWENRSAVGADDIVHYLAGMELDTTRLLTHMQTWVGGTEVRDYRLDYSKSPATGRPLIDWVQTCAFNSNGRTCFKPATFSYQGQHAPHYVSEDSQTLGVDYVPPTGGSVACNYGFSRWLGYPTDFDGDGLTDLVHVSKNLAGNFVGSVQYGKPGVMGGFGAPVSLSSDQSLSGTHTWALMHTPMDFNLDGRSDSFIVDSTLDANHNVTSSELKVVYRDASSANAGTVSVKDLGIDFPPGEPAFIQGFPTYAKVPFRTRLQTSDVNGDGKSDIVFEAEPSDGVFKWHVYLASGTGDGTSYSLAQTLPAPGKSDFLKALDYDADGRSDMLVHYKDAAHYVLLHSTGSGYEVQVTNIPFIKDVKHIPVPIIPVDLNGDSLPDVLEPGQKSSGAWDWFVYLNTGSADAQFAARRDTGLQVASDGYGMALANMVKVVRDPDGRQDLLMATDRSYTAPIIQQVCPEKDGRRIGTCVPVTTPSGCTAMDIRQPGDMRPGTDGHDGYDWELYRPSGNGDNLTLSDAGIGASQLQDSSLTLDFNHDGLPDISGQYAEGPGYDEFVAKRLSYAAGDTGDPMPDLLASVDNGFGVHSTWSYQPVNQPAVGINTGTSSYPNMVFESPMQVVATFKQTNPVGGNNETDYKYQNARYNVAGRGFVGFGRVTAIDVAHGTTSVTTYDQDPNHAFPLYGRQIGQQTIDNATSQVFETSSTTWDDKVYGSGNDKRYVVYASASSRTQDDPVTGVQISDSTTSQPDVDACGNPTGHVLQNTTTQQATQRVDTHSGYNGGNADACWKDTVNRRKVSTTLTYIHAPATTDTLTTETDYGYDASEHVLSKDVCDPNCTSPVTARRWTYGYDSFGNRNSVTQHDGSDSRTTQSSYGGDGYFPESVTNAKNQTATFTYDPATGNKTSATDPNGIETDYAFDAFGRNQGGKTPGASPVYIEYLDPGAAGLSCPTAPRGVETYALRKTQEGYPTSYTCKDAFGDTLRSATQGFAADGWVYVDSTYDQLGRKVSRTTPHFVDKPSSVTTTIYDVLDRPTETDSPTRKVDTSYDGLIVTYQDHDKTGRSSLPEHDYTRYYDGLGKGNGHLVQVDQQTQHDGTYVATYRYDAGGNLVRATDPAGNAITATYDGFGDKLSLVDPDKGSWSYHYDGFGEQTKETNAERQTITTQYDVLGRPTEVDDPADHRVTRTTYDTALNGQGKPAKETLSESGAVVYVRRYGYDEAGRQRVTEITTGGHTYLQGVGYDDKGRETARAYPAMGGGANSGPTLSASATPSGAVAVNTTVHLNASLQDPNGDWALSYRWTEDSGPDIGFSGSDEPDTTVTLSTAGTYKFTVSASDGLVERSRTFTVTAEVPPPPPMAPLITPNPSGSGSYNVQWGSVTGADTYKLQERPPGTSSWTTRFNGAGHAWSASGRANGTYDYRVAACSSGGGCGDPSAVATETVALVPATPTNLHHVTPPVLISPGSSFTLAWDAMANATSYQLAMNGTTATQTGIGGTSASVTAPSRGDTIFTMRVRACGTGGCSGWSDPISLTTTPGSTGGGGFRPLLMAAPGGGGADGGTGALVVATDYDDAGYPVTLSRASDGYTYMHVNAMNAWGDVTQVYEGGLGPGTATVAVTRGYDPDTGALVSVDASKPQTNAPLAHITATWDGFGNLTSRSADAGSEAQITYDELNRLTGSVTTTSGGSFSDSYQYDATGNRTEWDETDSTGHITHHSYTYGQGVHNAGPHAVNGLNGDTSRYSYDANGQMLKDAGRTLTWSAFGKATSVTQGRATLNFSYGPGNSRYKKLVTGPGSETVTYLGGAERLNVNGSLSIRRSLGMAGLTVIDTGGANAGVHYAIPDHLGSMMALIDSSGSLTQSLSYGDFGTRCGAGFNCTPPPGGWFGFNTTLTDKGYTGQESLDSVGLVDYNARLYDPSLGRFLSVDPVIGHAGSTQSINPYSYVENNPLNRTDPTGEVDDACTTDGCRRIQSGNGAGIGGIDWNVSKTKGGGIVVTPTNGPGNIESVMHQPVAGFLAQNSTGNISIAQHQIDNKTAARLSSCGYHTSCGGVDRFKRQSNKQLKALGLKPGDFLNKTSGFQAALFYNGETYVLVFAGTQPHVNDWETDGAQADGLRTTQYDEAVHLSRAVARATNGNVTLTGHSLGGGLAMAGALWAHVHAVVFNSAWLSRGTIARYGLDTSEASSLITAYHTEFDPVTAGQEMWDLYHITNIFRSTSDSDYLVPLGHQVEIPGWHFHSISGVCEGLGTSC